MTVLSMRTWTAPSSVKTALLIHGNREMGDAWWAVAEGLVKEGYAVHAPDILNNGFSSSTTPPHTVNSYVSFLADNLPKAQQYDVFCGVSLGGNIAIGLYKHFTLANGRTPPNRMVLLEPGLEVKMPRSIVERIKESADVPTSEDVLRKENPLWRTTDVVVDRLGLVQTNKEAFQAMFSGDGPKFPTHDILPDPDQSTGCDIIILAGDPKRRAMYKCDVNLPILQYKKPHVKLGRVEGAAHLIHKDKPQSVVDAMTGKFTQSQWIEVLRE